ncbi:YqgE/AlgH family protein [Sphingomicrobium flavum]|uniref:YqgE/AlgH family protein n=1 Tax=Sphingomicrobium flavum TaxID=1229164 RepID=UPI0021AD947C|nr:YqgE/AlgH family protein [Sphingomicrobium flavum]
MDTPRFLTGQLLLAMPGMSDPRFEKAVILMAAHDEEGALGVGIGRRLPGLKLRELLDQLELDPGEAPDVPVHHGGPVEPGRGFVLHSLDWAGQDSVQVAELCGLTGTLDVLKAIAEGKGPSRFIVSLGYAGWDAGQLDDEMTRHGWFAAPATPDLLFATEAAARWDAAFAAQGIDPSLLVGESGAA